MIITSLVFCLFLLVVPTITYAIESPQQYFDYNHYYEPNVLGVFAQESSPSGEAVPVNYRDYKEFGGYFLAFTKDMTPDNPLYFLKRMEENVGLVLTMGNPVARAETLLAIGGERTAELDDVAFSGKTNAIKKLVADYDRTMADQTRTLETLKGKPEATPVMLETDKEVAKHMLTLEEVSLKVPEAASAHIQTAIAKAEEVVDRVADASGRPAVPQDMIARLQAYKAQGLLSEEEVTKIVSATSRRDARSEFRKLADSRAVPLADVKKFDEAAASYYPDGYARAVELRKFRELASLEKDRPDEGTVTAVQEFAKNYKPGDLVPPAIRSWWAPMVRLEELQATFRPDLLDAAAYFKYRPEEQQKYTELVERMKPTDKDLRYVQNLVATNPTAAGDPAYSRVLMLGERFGTADASGTNSPVAQSCSRESHWVNVPFMPGGGYCVPDLVYQSLSRGTAGGDTPCPPNYHRAAAGGACYPDNPGGAGITNYLPAAGSCPSGYSWRADKVGPRGGYCEPQYTTGSGGYPSPITPPSYCPQGKIFREGKCEDYNPPPAQGCAQGSWWNGQKCIEQKNCGEGKYQDSNGECKSSAEEYKKYQSQCQNRPVPPGGCGGGWWDMASCSCVGGGGSGGVVSTDSMKAACERGGCRWTGVGNACECSGSGGGGAGTPSAASQEAACRAGGGRCVSWVNGACGCERGTSGGGSSTGGGSSGAGCPAGSNWVPEPTNPRGGYCASGGGYSGGGYSGGGYTPPPSSYNPEEMCRRTPNCAWANGACGCSSSGGSGSGGSSSPAPSAPPSCGGGYYWNGSSCVASAPQPQPSSPPPSSPPPTTESQPASPPPPSSPPPSTESQPSSPPPAENPPPAPPPAEPPPPSP